MMDESGRITNENSWEGNEFVHIQQLAELLNAFDPEIRRLDFLLTHVEEIENVLREVVDEFPDGYDSRIKECEKIINELEGRIQREIGMRISGIYTQHWAKNVESLHKPFYCDRCECTHSKYDEGEFTGDCHGDFNN